jgi:N-acetylglucosamine-6-sulfatase
MFSRLQWYCSRRDQGYCHESAHTAQRRFLTGTFLALLFSTPYAQAVQPADLSLTNTVNDPTPVIGSQVTFTITVMNAGPGSVQHMSVRDRLPAGYAFVSSTPSTGTYTASNGYWNGFGLPVNASAQLAIVATVRASGNHLSIAEVRVSSNPDPDSTPSNGNPAEDDYGQVTTTPRRPNAPVITGQQPLPLTTPEDTALTVGFDNLLVTDPDTPYPAGFTLTLQPGANYTLPAPDRLLPDSNVNGALTVPVIVNDGRNDSNTFLLQVTVTPVNDVPVITGQTALSTRKETALAITLDDLTVSDPDNAYPTDFTLALLPGEHYTITGSNEITPAVGFLGDLTVPSTVTDGADTSDVFDLVVSVTAAPPPNMVLIMLDDLDNRSLQDLLNAGLLPNVQASIVDRSFDFTQSHVTTPLCCPSRASYYSGQYAHNHGIVNNTLLYPGVTGVYQPAGLFDDSVTVATRLQAVGYTTAHVGKYLNGYGAEPSLAPQWPAFEPHYVPPGWSTWYGLVDPSTYCVYEYTINHDGELTEYPLPPGESEDTATYQTNVIADIGESFLLEHRDDTAPFYLELMPIVPHAEKCTAAYNGSPPPMGDDSFALRIRPAPEYENAGVPDFVPSPSYDEDLSDKPDYLSSEWPALTPDDLANVSEQYRGRLRAMLSVDDLVRRIVAALGPAIDNTIIVLTSDNGWLYGEHRLSGKVFAYEESSAVPLYIVTPGAAAAQSSSALVLNNDLAPTLLDLASPGYSDARFDGRSMAPLLQGGGPGTWNRKQFVVEFARTFNAPTRLTYISLRNATTAYIETYDGRYYHQFPGLRIGLEKYDLVNDPHQLNSQMHLPEDARDPVLGPLMDLIYDCQGATCTQYEDSVTP